MTVLRVSTALRRLQQAVRGLDPMLLEQADRLHGGQVAPLLVAGADLERRDDLAVALQLRLRQDPRHARGRPGAGPWAARARARPDRASFPRQPVQGAPSRCISARRSALRGASAARRRRRSTQGFGGKLLASRHDAPRTAV